ncbi:diiron oxygenase [Jeongeupia wiesaeckerbachi]|uniref:diiron oxygenase n=1 Tax=Jeongeupia wiesaeckerbachi TaxID=3051218 RepID=UPI003D8011F0
MAYSEAVREDSVATMLQRLSALWQTRAAVNQGPSDYAGLVLDPEKHDFSESLLPFKDHQAWLSAPPALKSQCLSYAWGIYNLKTIYIECDIVTPACEDLIKAPPSFTKNRELIQDVISEALLDEALHTRMSIGACNYIYRERGLTPLDFEDFNLVRWRDEALSKCGAEWERRLTRFGIACASETLITDYLKTMAEDQSIQAICHQVTRTHAVDEWSHSSVFSFVAADLVHGLSQGERQHLREIILKTVQLFANNELGAWRSAFELVGLPNYEAILNETGDSNEIGVYTDSVEALIERIGLADRSVRIATSLPASQAVAEATS